MRFDTGFIPVDGEDLRMCYSSDNPLVVGPDHHRPAEFDPGHVPVGGFPFENPPHIPPCHARSRRADPVFAHAGPFIPGGLARS